MGKVICDICGTVYQDTAESCPICGYLQILGEEEFTEDLLMEEEARGKGGRFEQTKKHKEIFDYDEVNPEEDDEDEEEEEYDEEDSYVEEPKSNTAIVIILVIIIMLLLAAVGFIFFRYFLPNMSSVMDGQAATTVATDSLVAETEETTEPTIPCESIVLTGGMAELNTEGQFWLLHVKVMPENTTDELVYVSEDESIATVTEDGKITAVGEGETTIYITCGKQQINCPVIVKYVEETEPDAEETVEGTSAEEETAETEVQLKDVTLALKKYDISLTVGYGVTLELDCDLEASEVEWSVEHSHIATVDENGFVKAVGYGTTAVTAKYGDQEVTCMIRCK